MTPIGRSWLRELRIRCQSVRDLPDQTLKSVEIWYESVFQRAAMTSFEGRLNYFTLRALHAKHQPDVKPGESDLQAFSAYGAEGFF